MTRFEAYPLGFADEGAVLELVRGMVGEGFGYSVLVTRPFSAWTYGGREVASVEISDNVAPSGLVSARLKRNQLTKPAQLFVDFCREQLSSTPASEAYSPLNLVQV